MYKNISVDYIDHMGDDKRIADVARVSFSKIMGGEEDAKKTERLLAYLESGLPSEERTIENRAKAHSHWSPFAHCFLSVKITAPIFLARQLVKHQVGLSWNEVSRRYTTEDISFYLPEVFHEKPEGSIKQGCGKACVRNKLIKDLVGYVVQNAYETYLGFVEEGVAPEEARMILPQNMNVTWVWSGSLAAFMRVYLQRSDIHAQSAARDFAKELGKVIKDTFPLTFKTYTEWRK